MEEPLYNFQIRWTNSGHARIAYYVRGRGPALILLHGLSGSSRWWLKNAPVLARYFRVYVVDIIGFGRSRGQKFALQEAPGLILKWMESVDEERISLVGHSMGGYIAASLASVSERVDKLVLVDALGQSIGRSLARSAWGLIESFSVMPRDFYPILVSDAMRAGPYTLLRAVHDVLQPDLSIAFDRIEARSLIVWGDRDYLLPLQAGQRLHEYLPGSRLEIMSGAGHVAMWDRADEFNQLTLEFLRSD